MHLIGHIRFHTERLQIELYPSRLRVIGIEIDHRQDDIGPVLGSLAVADHLLVADWMEAQTPVAVQGAVVAADGVEARNERAQALRALDIPLPDLVFL